MSVSRGFENFPIQDLFKLIRSLSKFGIKWSERNRSVLCLICYSDVERYNSDEHRHFCGKYMGSCKFDLTCQFKCSLYCCLQTRRIQFKANFLHRCFLNTYFVAAFSRNPRRSSSYRSDQTSTNTSSSRPNYDRLLQQYILQVARFITGQSDEVDLSSSFIRSYTSRRPIALEYAVNNNATEPIVNLRPSPSISRVSFSNVQAAPEQNDDMISDYQNSILWETEVTPLRNENDVAHIMNTTASLFTIADFQSNQQNNVSTSNSIVAEHSNEAADETLEGLNALDQRTVESSSSTSELETLGLQQEADVNAGSEETLSDDNIQSSLPANSLTLPDEEDDEFDSIFGGGFEDDFANEEVSKNHEQVTEQMLVNTANNSINMASETEGSQTGSINSDADFSIPNIGPSTQVNEAISNAVTSSDSYSEADSFFEHTEIIDVPFVPSFRDRLLNSEEMNSNSFDDNDLVDNGGFDTVSETDRRLTAFIPEIIIYSNTHSSLIREPLVSIDNLGSSDLDNMMSDNLDDLLANYMDVIDQSGYLPSNDTTNMSNSIEFQESFPTIFRNMADRDASVSIYELNVDSDKCKMLVQYDIDYISICCSFLTFTKRIELYYSPTNFLSQSLNPNMPSLFMPERTHKTTSLDLFIGRDGGLGNLCQKVFLIVPHSNVSNIKRKKLAEDFINVLSITTRKYYKLPLRGRKFGPQEIPLFVEDFILKGRQVKDGSFILEDQDAREFCKILHAELTNNQIFSMYKLLCIKYGQKCGLVGQFTNQPISMDEIKNQLGDSFQKLRENLFDNYNIEYINLVSFSLARETSCELVDDPNKKLAIVGRRSFLEDLCTANYARAENTQDITPLVFDSIETATDNEDFVENEESSEREGSQNNSQEEEVDESSSSETSSDEEDTSQPSSSESDSSSSENDDDVCNRKETDGEDNSDYDPDLNPIASDTDTEETSDDSDVDEREIISCTSKMKSATQFLFAGTQEMCNISIEYKIKSIRNVGWMLNKPVQSQRKVYCDSAKVFRDFSGAVHHEYAPLAKAALKLVAERCSEKRKPHGEKMIWENIKYNVQMKNVMRCVNSINQKSGSLRDEITYYCADIQSMFDHIEYRVLEDGFAPGINGSNESFFILHTENLKAIYLKQVEQVQKLIIKMLVPLKNEILSLVAIEIINFLEFYLAVLQHGFPRGRLKVFYDLFSINVQRIEKNFAFLDPSLVNFKAGKFVDEDHNNIIKEKNYLYHHLKNRLSSKDTLIVQNYSKFAYLNLISHDNRVQAAKLLISTLIETISKKLKKEENQVKRMLRVGNASGRRNTSSVYYFIRLYFFSNTMKCSEKLTFSAARKCFIQIINTSSYKRYRGYMINIIYEELKRTIKYLPQIYDSNLLQRPKKLMKLDFDQEKSYINEIPLEKLLMHYKNRDKVEVNKNNDQSEDYLNSLDLQKYFPVGFVGSTNKIEALKSINEELLKKDEDRTLIHHLLDRVLNKYINLLRINDELVDWKVLCYKQFILFFLENAEVLHRPKSEKTKSISFLKRRMQENYHIDIGILREMGIFSDSIRTMMNTSDVIQSNLNYILRM